MAFEIDPLIASFAGPSPGAAARRSEAWLQKFTGTSRIVAEELASLGAAADHDLVTIPDGRKVRAVEYVALMTFAYDNQFCQWTLWPKVKKDRSGHVTVVGPLTSLGITDITALVSCTKIKTLYPHGNHIADISTLPMCSKLQQLWLGSNRISDISALASCAKLDTLCLINNKISHISPLARCSRLITLDLYGNQIADLSALTSLKRLRRLYLGQNQIADISPLERCSQLQCLSVPDNPLSKKSKKVLLKLHERGVTVDH